MSDNRELVLRMEGAESDIIHAINRIIQIYNLPCFLLEPIVDKIHRQLLEGRANEISAAKAREASMRSENAQTE